jgi:hypothetical protein
VQNAIQHEITLAEHMQTSLFEQHKSRVENNKQTLEGVRLQSQYDQTSQVA